MSLPKTRKEAMQAFSGKYCTNLPCINGHTTYRYTDTGACAACVRGYNKKLSAEGFRNRIRRKKVSVIIHPDDEAKLLEFVNFINKTRSALENAKPPTTYERIIAPHTYITIDSTGKIIKTES